MACHRGSDSSGATVTTRGQRRIGTADLQVLAVPVERARELLGSQLRALVPGEEPAVFALSRAQDSVRYALGLPHVLADRT